MLNVYWVQGRKTELLYSGLNGVFEVLNRPEMWNMKLEITKRKWHPSSSSYLAVQVLTESPPSIQFIRSTPGSSKQAALDINPRRNSFSFMLSSLSFEQQVLPNWGVKVTSETSYRLVAGQSEKIPSYKIVPSFSNKITSLSILLQQLQLQQ